MRTAIVLVLVLAPIQTCTIIEPLTIDISALDDEDSEHRAASPRLPDEGCLISCFDWCVVGGH